MPFGLLFFRKLIQLIVFTSFLADDSLDSNITSFASKSSVAFSPSPEMSTRPFLKCECKLMIAVGTVISEKTIGIKPPKNNALSIRVNEAAISLSSSNVSSIQAIGKTIG